LGVNYQFSEPNKIKRLRPFLGILILSALLGFGCSSDSETSDSGDAGATEKADVGHTENTDAGSSENTDAGGKELGTEGADCLPDNTCVTGLVCDDSEAVNFSESLSKYLLCKFSVLVI